MSVKFAPGKNNVHEDAFSPSVILFWLKDRWAVSSMRIVGRRPNTLLGLIPLGYSSFATPLTSVAGVGVNVAFSLGRMLFGLLLLIVGLSVMGQSVILGLILVLLGMANLLNAMSASMDIQNHGGGVTSVRVSILEKAKLEAFVDEVNARLHADHAKMRHAEHMNVQQQLNSQMFGNQVAQAQAFYAQQQYLASQGHPQNAQPHPSLPSAPSAPTPTEQQAQSAPSVPPRPDLPTAGPTPAPPAGPTA